MKTRFLLATFLLTAAPLAQAVPIEWTGNGNTYEVVTWNDTLSWAEAKGLAEGMGGYLATITSASENDFVAWLVTAYGWGNRERYWLGGYQTSYDDEPGGNWAWVTGETWDYTNWEVGEPNNDIGGTQNYLHYWREPGLWDDMENRDVMDGFVVEWGASARAVSEPGTLALLGAGLLAFGLIRRRRLQPQRSTA